MQDATDPFGGLVRTVTPMAWPIFTTVFTVTCMLCGALQASRNAALRMGPDSC